MNTNLHVETDRGRFFLRVYEGSSEAEVAAELALISYLRERGVKTPAVLSQKDGAAMGTLLGKPAALFEFVQGTVVCLQKLSVGELRSVGQALAELHLAARKYQGIGSGRFCFDEITQRVCELGAVKDPEVAEIWSLLDQEVHWLISQKASEPQGVIHSDLFRDNVLFDETGSPWVIDFASACWGSWAYDLATCLLSWTFTDDFRADWMQALIAGYSQIRQLDAQERAFGLYVEVRRAALRFTVTRILDFHLRQASGPRVRKDFRRYLKRLLRLRSLEPRNFGLGLVANGSSVG